MAALAGRILLAVLGCLFGLYGEEAGWNPLSAALVVALFALIFWDIAQNLAERRRRRLRDERPQLTDRSSYAAPGAMVGINVGLIGEEDTIPPDPLVWVVVFLVFLLVNAVQDWRKLTNPGIGPRR